MSAAAGCSQPVTHLGRKTLIADLQSKILRAVVFDYFPFVLDLLTHLRRSLPESRPLRIIGVEISDIYRLDQPVHPVFHILDIAYQFEYRLRRSIDIDLKGQIHSSSSCRIITPDRSENKYLPGSNYNRKDNNTHLRQSDQAARKYPGTISQPGEDQNITCD